MCKFWQWLLNQGTPPVPIPEPEPIPGGKKRIALLFGINNYPGSANDLNGCLNDVDDCEAKLKAEFPDFIIQKYKDAQVTCENFYNYINNVILTLTTGDHIYVAYSGHGTQVPSNSEPNGYHEALYLYNGVFLDDQVQSLIAMIPAGVNSTWKFDCCFSGDMLRPFNNPIKNRFYPMPGIPIRHRAIRKFAKKAIPKNCVVISGCSENQTSADAFIEGKFRGAFTYFDNRSFDANTIYVVEMINLHNKLPSATYQQNPTIDGDSSLFNKKVFT